MKARLSTSLFASALLALSVGGCATRGSAVADAQTDAVPDFPSAEASAWVNGDAVSLAKERGRVVLVEAWHPLCTSCLASAPAIIALKTRYEARGLRVVGVTELDSRKDQEEVAEILKTAKHEGMSYPSYLDQGAAWLRTNHVEELPSFILIGKDGHRRYVHHDQILPGSAEEQELAAAIESALGPG